LGKTVSSQSVSAIAMIGSSLRRGARLVFADRLTSESYVSLTIAMLRRWQDNIEILPNRVGGTRARAQFIERAKAVIDRVAPSSIRLEDADSAHSLLPEGFQIAPGCSRGRHDVVEPDASSAAYWWASALLTSSSKAFVPGIRQQSFQPDIEFALLVEDVGGAIDWMQAGTGSRGCAAHIALGQVNAARIPDAAVMLSVLAAAANAAPDHQADSVAGPLSSKWRVSKPFARDRPSELGLKSHIGGLRTLRVKETDRIAALASELRKVGCSVETGEDWISIEPPGKYHRRDAGAADPVIIETYNDHRMAMAFAVLGLVRPGISIRNPKCVAKSYPTFWKDFAKLYR